MTESPNALLAPLPPPPPFDELEFKWDPYLYGRDTEAMRWRIGRDQGFALVDLSDCKGVLYIRDPDARGLFAFLRKKAVLALDPALVKARRLEVAQRVAKEVTEAT